MFAVSSGIGYDAEVCERVLTSDLKKILNRLKLGRLTYLLIGLMQALIYKPADGELIIDGITKVKLKKIFFIASMIQKSEGGVLKMTPCARNNDGLLSLCIVSGISKLRIFYTIPALFFGRHTNMKGIKIINCRQAEIITNSPLTVHTDGEINGRQQHIQITCSNDKLRFIK